MATSKNIQSEAEILKISKIRDSKILKDLNKRNSSAEISDELESEYILNMGPQHPSTHGVLRMVLRLDGETVIKVVPELGYLHRGYEKLAENMHYQEFIPFTDRLDYASPTSNNTGIALAIENAFGIEAPERAQWIRVMVSELARISSHLLAIGSFCLDLGAFTIMLWALGEREKLDDIFELICGARFTTSYTRIGGVMQDISPEAIQKIRDWLKEFPEKLGNMRKLVDRNRIFIDRVAGLGYMSKEKAISLGVTGASLRASGSTRDLRRDNPYLVYDKLDFDVITLNEGDCWARYMIRVMEMYESHKIINATIENMPSGPIILHAPKKSLPRKKKVYTKMEELIHDFMLVYDGAIPEPGETYTAIEGPKGEMGFFIVSDGTGYPWKLKIRSPSSANLQAMPFISEGVMISDLVACLASLDPIMGDADK